MSKFSVGQNVRINYITGFNSSKTFLNGHICTIINVLPLTYNGDPVGIDQYELEWNQKENTGRLPVMNPNIYKWYGDELALVVPHVVVKNNILPDI